MKVRIRKTPSQDELDGVRLDCMTPGVVCEVSPSIGSWLITERFAMSEMRAELRAHEEDFLTGRETASGRVSSERRRRRSNDERSASDSPLPCRCP